MTVSSPQKCPSVEGKVCNGSCPPRRTISIACVLPVVANPAGVTIDVECHNWSDVHCSCVSDYIWISMIAVSCSCLPGLGYDYMWISTITVSWHCLWELGYDYMWISTIAVSCHRLQGLG